MGLRPCKKICKLIVLPYFNIHVRNSNKRYDCIFDQNHQDQLSSTRSFQMTCCCSWWYFKAAWTWITRQSCIFSDLAGQNWAWHLFLLQTISNIRHSHTGQIDRMCGINYFTVVTADVTTYHIFMFWTRQRQTPRAAEKHLLPSEPCDGRAWTRTQTFHTSLPHKPSCPDNVLCPTSGRLHIDLDCLIFSPTAVTLVSYQQRVCVWYTCSPALAGGSAAVTPRS